MDVLVDTSVWISFFRGRKEDAKVCEALDYLLSGDEVVVDQDGVCPRSGAGERT